MRDPQGTRHVEGDKIVRTLRAVPGPDHFLRSDVAARWIREGLLVDFEWRGTDVVAERLPFVTGPDEWCDAQLHDAARLTLNLQQQAVGAGYDLKDASAWNVIFDGSRPVFCDLLSFTSLTQRQWWAMGQYARHFLFPLLASRRRGLPANRVFAMWRDGFDVKAARVFFGPTAYLTRYGLLLLGAGDAVHANAGDRGVAQPVLEHLKSFRQRLHAGMDWMLAGVAPAGAKPAVMPLWANYENDRLHYGGSSLDLKRETVSGWLERIRAGWVADLGCNTGEFSRIAADAGARVIAVDSDHDSVQRLYLSALHRQRVYPLVAQLDDIGGGRGWAGNEYPGLAQRFRGSADVVMMLALTHHLAIGAAVPLDAIAAFAATCTRRWLIAELIDERDPQLMSLCAQRQREPAEFSMRCQRDAFSAAGFVPEGEVDLQPALRTLVLFRKSNE